MSSNTVNSFFWFIQSALQLTSLDHHHHHLIHSVADLRALFIDNFYRLCNVLENLDEYDNLKLIVYFDPLNDLRRQRMNAILETKRNRDNCEILSLDQLIVRDSGPS